MTPLDMVTLVLFVFHNKHRWKTHKSQQQSSTLFWPLSRLRCVEHMNALSECLSRKQEVLHDEIQLLEGETRVELNLVCFLRCHDVFKEAIHVSQNRVQHLKHHQKTLTKTEHWLHKVCIALQAMTCSNHGNIVMTSRTLSESSLSPCSNHGNIVMTSHTLSESPPSPCSNHGNIVMTSRTLSESLPSPCSKSVMTIAADCRTATSGSCFNRPLTHSRT